MRGAGAPTVLQIGNLKPDSSNGVHRAMARLSRHLVDSGVSVVVVHPTRSVRAPVRRTTEGITIVDIPVSAPPGRSGAHLQIPTRSGLAELKHLKGAAAVHLHSVHQPDHLWTCHLAERAILAPHNGYHPMVQNGRARVLKALWRGAFDRPLVRRATVVQVLSQAERDDVRALVPSASVEELQFPIAPIAGAGSLEVGVRRGGFTFIGRLDVMHKGLDILIAAWGRTRSARKRSALTIAGPGSDATRRRLASLVSRYGVNGSVHIAPEIHGSAKQRLLAETSWFLHPSRWEGLPVAPIEAMALGIPVVVSRSTNLGPLVESYCAGLTTDGTIASLATAMDQAVDESPADNQIRVDGCRSLVAENFSWPKLWPRYQRLYGIS